MFGSISTFITIFFIVSFKIVNTFTNLYGKKLNIYKKARSFLKIKCISFYYVIRSTIYTLKNVILLKLFHLNIVTLSLYPKCVTLERKNNNTITMYITKDLRLD
jgi:hypothetical protein